MINNSKLLECFGNDYIGLPDCNGVIPVSQSGWNLRDLSYFSISKTIKSANLESEFSAYEVLRQRLDFSIKSVASDIINYMLETAKLEPQKTLESLVIGNYSAQYLPINIAIPNRKVGIIITKCASNHKNYDRLARIFIPYIDILFSTTGTYQIEVTDGPNLTNYSVSTIANQVTRLDLSYMADTDRVRIAVIDNQTGFNASTITYNNCTSCSPAYCMNATGFDNNTVTSYTYGLTPMVEYRCNYTDFICSIKGQIGELVLHKLGEELVNHILYSGRVNGVTLKIVENTDIAKTAKTIYMTKLQQYLKTLNNLSRIFGSRCFVCRDSRYSTIRL